jgi:hypothetical protein
VTITDNAMNSPQSAPLSGVGTYVELTPTSLTFPPTKVGHTTPAKTVTLTNVSTSAVSISGINIVGAGMSDFSITTNTCGSSVAGGGTCTISVTFTPQQTGSLTATLDVNDNGGGSPQTVSLAGTGE